MKTDAHMSETGDRAGASWHRPKAASGPSAGVIGRPAKLAGGKYVSKSEMVTDALRDLIIDRRLSPGTPLRQRELARQFDVSYTPVREALRRLESEGLVVSDVHKGARSPDRFGRTRGELPDPGCARIAGGKPRRIEDDRR